MKSKSWLILIVMVLCATAYAIVLQTTGQAQAAVHFVKWAGGGLCVLAILGWLLGAIS